MFDCRNAILALFFPSIVKARRSTSKLYDSMRWAIAYPKEPIGGNSLDRTTSLFLNKSGRHRKLGKSSKSSKSSKKSKSSDPNHVRVYYVIAYPPPPTSQETSWTGKSAWIRSGVLSQNILLTLFFSLDFDYYTYYDPHSDYHYNNHYTETPSYSIQETERGGFPSLDGKWIRYRRLCGPVGLALSDRHR